MDGGRVTELCDCSEDVWNGGRTGERLVFVGGVGGRRCALVTDRALERRDQQEMHGSAAQSSIDSCLSVFASVFRSAVCRA